MLNRTLKTNFEPHWPLKSNLELRWPPFVCHVIWAVFASRNARTFVRSEDSEPFVRRTSRMKKRAYERILTFGTAQSNTPSDITREEGFLRFQFDMFALGLEDFLHCPILTQKMNITTCSSQKLTPGIIPNNDHMTTIPWFSRCYSLRNRTMGHAH